MRAPLRYGTMASGYCAPSIAWKRRGWQPVYFSEIAKFPSQVLKYHYPHVPNLGDMNHLHTNPTFLNEPVDVVCAGTPCQAFSVAGLRAGMDSPNGNLALVFLKLLSISRPRWMVWENVPGVLSSWSDAETDNEGRIWQNNDFETFLSGLRELGYGVAWRVLDAQHFGVPQQRRRVFVVGYLGDWRPASAVLFERESLCGHPKAMQKTGQAAAPFFASGIGVSGADVDQAREGHLVANTLTANGHRGASQQDAERGFLVISAEGSTGLPSETASNIAKKIHNQAPLVFQSGQSASRDMNPGEVSPAMGAANGKKLAVFQPMAFQERLGSGHGGKGFLGQEDMAYTVSAQKVPRVFVPSVEVAPTLNAGSHNKGPGTVPDDAASLLHGSSGVRRLTPLECERLQGIPDFYTRIPMRLYKKPKFTKLRPPDMWEETPEGWWLMAADGPRYQIIGNGMAVPVLDWLGERIEIVDNLINEHYGNAT